MKFINYFNGFVFFYQDVSLEITIDREFQMISYTVHKKIGNDGLSRDN